MINYTCASAQRLASACLGTAVQVNRRGVATPPLSSARLLLGGNTRRRYSFTPAHQKAARAASSGEKEGSQMERQRYRGGGGGLLGPWFRSGGHPLTEMGHMLKQLEHMMDFGSSPMLADPMMPEVWEGTMVPSVDISETPEKFQISADLPGLTKADVKIEVVEGTGEYGPLLKISGEHAKEDEGSGEVEGTEAKWHRVERVHAKFLRTMRLPKTADADQISASMKHGVLKLTVGKKEVVSAITERVIDIMEDE